MNWRDFFSKLNVQKIIIVAVAVIIFSTVSVAAEEVDLVIDGRKIQSEPKAILQNGRTLVPVRLVSETLGAYVEWDEKSKTVGIRKGERFIKLRIDNRLIDYNEGLFDLTDVPPQIINDSTFVPLRLVSNALGVAVDWNSENRTVEVDSSIPTTVQPLFDVKISTIQDWQTVTGTSELKVDYGGVLPSGASELRFLLLDPETGKGPIIARGNDFDAVYSWLPDPFYNGSRVLAAAMYDQEGEFLAGSVKPVNLAVAPKVNIEGIEDGEVVDENVAFSANLNFVAEYVKYEIKNTTTGEKVTTEEMDPYGEYLWSPDYTANGKTVVKITAYDRLGNAYQSPEVSFHVNIEKKLVLRGVAAGTTIEKPVTLWLSRNFPLDITNLKYIIKDVDTGKEKILAEKNSYFSFRWFPGPEERGDWELYAEVKDSEGNVYITNELNVQVSGKKKLLLQSVGPHQVLTGEMNLKSLANVSLKEIRYLLIDPQTGSEQIIIYGDPEQEYSWEPDENYAGTWTLQAVGISTSGEKVTSEAIPIEFYFGKIYERQPVMEKSKFLDFASQLAQNSHNKTGMSAALQTAQSILETGWGQYTPVDKYTGQLSYNLFGIKGEGPAGSVIYNTWEEYNGNVFRIDAEFRAYDDPAQSWTDHKELLLTSERYQSFREVMYDSIQGAWALKRAGYATDSKYPLKLIDIIKRYNLHLLDEVKI